MRKLASIQKIKKLNPIPGADKIEVATVLGWQVVVKKGEFKVGDLIVYCEIDSILPDKPEFEFLKNKKFRIKTIRLKGQVSQGICFPLSILSSNTPDKKIVWVDKKPTQHRITIAKDEVRVKIGNGLEHERELLKLNVLKIMSEVKYKDKTLRGHISKTTTGCRIQLSTRLRDEKYYVDLFDEDSDVTDLLGVTKYLPSVPTELAGLVKGTFPSGIPKTDETRAQTLQKVLTKHIGKKCYVTEKVDGASVTYYYKNNEFGVCSRTLDLKETDNNAFWLVARKLNIEEKLKALGKNIAIQGELIGQGIQKNPLKIEGKKVLFFNAFDIDNYKYYEFDEFTTLIIDLDLEMVPLLNINYTLHDNIISLIEEAKGMSQLNPKSLREGIVIRPLKETTEAELSNDFRHGRLSFKVINQDYLLKEK